MNRVLIVEDENIIALDLAERLKTQGFEIAAICRTGQEALQVAARSEIDLILMDIVLPESLDGIETASQILKLRKVPIVFLTAYSDTITISRLKEIAPSGYLLKPYRDRELAVVIELAMYKFETEKLLTTKQAELEKLNSELEERVRLRTAELSHEIEERKQIESALRRNEEALREMAEFMPMIVTETDENFLLKFFNKSGMEKLGYQRGERLPYLTLTELFTESCRERARRDMQAILKGEKLMMGYYQLNAKDGAQPLRVLAVIAPIYRNGAIRGIRAGMLDIAPVFTGALLPAERFYSDYNLTRQEKNIVNELARGLKNREITEKLHISDNTLKTHLSNIFSKMGVQNRDEVVELMATYQINNIGREKLVISLLEKVVYQQG